MLLKRLTKALVSMRQKLGKTWNYFAERPEKIFLFSVLIFGLFIVILMPPYRGIDEASHIYRIQELSQGDVFVEKIEKGYGHPIPDYMHRVNISEFTQSKRESVADAIERRVKAGGYADLHGLKTPQLFEGAGVYSPLIYAHMIPIGVIANTFKFNSYVYVLLLRLANLSLYIVCVYFAIKLAVFGKWFLAIVSLLPMNVHQAATVSGDVILYSSVLIFVALLTQAFSKEKKWGETERKKILVGLMVSGLIILIGKPGYFMLITPVLFVPKTLFDGSKNKKLALFSVFTVGVAVTLLWSYGLSRAGLSGTVESFRYRVNGGVAYTTNDVIKTILLHPLQTIKFFLNSFVRNIYHELPVVLTDYYNNSTDFILKNFTGFFGSINFALPMWASFLVILNLLVTFMAFGEKVNNRFNIRKKAILLACLTIQFLLIFMIFWLTWTRKDLPYVWGLQGRYFIPLLPLLVFFLPKKSAFTWSVNTSKIIIVTLTFLPLITMADLIFETFYKGLL